MTLSLQYFKVVVFESDLYSNKKCTVLQNTDINYNNFNWCRPAILTVNIDSSDSKYNRNNRRCNKQLTPCVDSINYLATKQ